MDMITVLEHRGATDINQKRGIFVRLDNERKRYVKISELQAGFPRAIGIEFQHENGVWSPLTPDYLNDQAFIFLPGDQSQYAVISSDRTTVRIEHSLEEFLEAEFHPLVQAHIKGRSQNAEYLATRAANPVSPKKLYSWPHFKRDAKRFEGKLQGTYPPINMPVNRIAIEFEAQLHLFELFARVRNVIHLEIHPELVFSGTKDEADICIMLGQNREIRAVGLVKLDWKILPDYQEEDVLTIYNSQATQANRLVNRGESVPNNKEFAIYWAVSQVFGYMLVNKTKYAVLTTFNLNWFFKFENKQLYVSPGIQCDSDSSPRMLKSLFYFLSLLIGEDAKLAEEFVNEIMLTLNDYEYKDGRLKYPRQMGQRQGTTGTNDPAQSTTSKGASSRQRSYQFDFAKLGACIGKGAIGSVRVYRDYFDGTVTHPQIAIKFIEIAKSDERYKQALKEVDMYNKLQELQGVCIPRMLFHASMYPYYLIGMTWIDGDHFQADLDLDLLPTLSDCLHKIHSCGIIHNDLRPCNVLVDKSRKPWIIDFDTSYYEQDMDVQRADEIETTDSLKPFEPVSSLENSLCETSLNESTDQNTESD